MRLRVIGLLALVFAMGCDRGDHPQQLGQKAPDFTVTRDGRTIRLDQFRGRVVVLNFWATWCAPCIAELPSLQQMQAQMPDVQVLAISMDDNAEAYAEFLSRRHVTLLNIRDGMEGANLKFGTERPPETFVIDRQGYIRRKFIGPQEWTSPEIVNYLKKL